MNASRTAPPLLFMQCVRLLLAYGADIRPENYWGKDAFTTAMYKQRIG